jgi:hypothetical protein
MRPISLGCMRLIPPPMYVLAVIIVALRLYCRLGVSKAGLWWDDYIICVALVWILIFHLDIYIAGILFFVTLMLILDRLWLRATSST